MSDATRLLIISGEYPPMEGGVADFTAIVGERLARLGAEVHVLTSTQVQDGASRGPITVHPRMTGWGFRSLYKAVRELVAEVQPDLVSIQYQTAAFGLHPAINLLPRAFPSVPMVVTFHDLRVPYILPKAGRLRRWVNVDLARMCDAAIVTNAQDRAQLEAMRQIDRMETIPIGSNISYRLPEEYDQGRWRSRWGIDEHTTLLCFFGFLNDTKGAIELIEALGLLCESGLDAALMMIGGAVNSSNAANQPYYDRVMAAIADSGSQDHISWTGYVPDEEISAAFESSDICVLPFADGASFRRGSLMAALAHGAAIISTEPQVPIAEMVHGENIYLVRAGDAQAIVRAVREITGDDALRQRLQQGARELSKQFDWDTIAERTLTLFQQVITARESAHKGMSREKGTP